MFACLLLVVISAVVLVILFYSPLRVVQQPIDTPELAGPRSGEPPRAALVIDGQEQASGVGSYCWRDASGDQQSVAVCVDMIGVPTAEKPLVIDSPFIARLQLSLDRPPETLVAEVFPVAGGDEIQISNGLRWWAPHPGARYELVVQADSEVTLDLDPGLHVLRVFARWSDAGDVTYGFLIEVEG